MFGRKKTKKNESEIILPLKSEECKKREAEEREAKRQADFQNRLDGATASSRARKAEAQLGALKMVVTPQINALKDKAEGLNNPEKRSAKESFISFFADEKETKNKAGILQNFLDELDECVTPQLYYEKVVDFLNPNKNPQYQTLNGHRFYDNGPESKSIILIRELKEALETQYQYLARFRVV